MRKLLCKIYDYDQSELYRDQNLQGATSIIINEDDIIADVTINSRSIFNAQSGFRKIKEKGQ